MPESSQRLISRPVFYGLVALGLVGVVLYALRGILAPVLLAFLLAYAFDPLVGWFCRHRIPRGLASGICLIILLLATTSLLALILPALQHEIKAVGEKLPAYVHSIQHKGIPWMEERLGIDIPETLDEALSEAQEQLSGKVGTLAGPVSSVLKSMLSGTLSLLSKLIYLIIIPLFTFYFLMEYQKIIGWFHEQIPPRFRTRLVEIFREVDEVLAGFLRGQMTVCATLAVAYSVALSIIGVNAAITIGIVAGLFNMVPYLGTVTGIILSCVFLLLEGAPWTTYLVVLALFTVVSVADGLFFTPRVLGNKLGLAPVVIILAILAFGEVFGFLGVLMAVPVTAIGKVLAKRALSAYRSSHLFGDSVDGT